MKILLYSVIILYAAIIYGQVAARAIDTQIFNQQTMLCQSALKSGNQDYLKKCDCYYQTGDIKCTL